MKKLVFLFIGLSLLVLLYVQFKPEATPPLPMSDMPKGEIEFQPLHFESLKEPSIAVTFLPGPNQTLDVVYSFATPVQGFKFSTKEDAPRKTWWTTSDADVVFTRVSGFDKVKFKAPKSSIRFTLNVPDDILNRNPAPIRFFDHWGAVVSPPYFRVQVIGKTFSEEFSTDYPSRPRHLFRMASPYPILQNEKADAVPKEAMTGDFLYETRHNRILSTTNSDVIENKAYRILIDPSFSKRTQGNIETTTAEAINYFHEAFGAPLAPHFTLSYMKGPYYGSSGWVSGRHSIMRLRLRPALNRDWNSTRASYVILHEIAHLYQGIYPTKHSNLFVEGGATAMAYIAAYDLGYVNEYIFRLKFENAQNRCIRGMKRHIADDLKFEALLIKEKQLPYDCGATLLDLILRAYPELSLFDFWKSLSGWSQYAQNNTSDIIAKTLILNHIPNTPFLNELDVFLKSAHPNPVESFEKLEALAVPFNPSN